MAAGTHSRGNREVSPPVLVGVLVVVVVVLGFIVWKVFAPPPEPMAGMSIQQKAEALKQAQKNLHPRNSSPLLRH